MEAKNLRIGNYLLTDYDYLAEVELMHKKHFDCRELTTGNFVLNGKYKPIPLTDEWINKFGFDDKEYKEGYTGIEFKTNMILDFVLTKPEFMGKWQDYYTYDLGQHRFVPLKYVHELQNLFFAITRQELELKTEVSA